MKSSNRCWSAFHAPELPVHHRDISMGNLMVNAAIARDEHEAQRMKQWLAWVG